MNDKEKFIDLLTCVGIGHSIHRDVILIEDNGEKVDGYSGFYIRLTFDTEGKFIKIGAFE